MKKLLTRFKNDQSGATAIEYGLIAAIVGVGLVTGLGSLTPTLTTTFNTVCTTLTAGAQ